MSSHAKGRMQSKKEHKSFKGGLFVSLKYLNLDVHI